MSAPVCDRCSRPLQRSSWDQPGVQTIGGGMPDMYLGVVCQGCGRVECNRCKGARADAPCSRCGSPVQPAWGHLFAQSPAASAFGDRSTAERLPWWKVVPGAVLAVALVAFLIWAVWDTFRADPPPYLTAPGESVRTLAVSADGRWAAAAGDSSVIRLYDVQAARATRDLSSPVPARWLAFLPDGRHVVSAGERDTVRLWDRESGQLVRQFGVPPEARNEPAGPPGLDVPPPDAPPRPFSQWGGAGLSADGNRLLAADHTAAYGWDSATGRHLFTVPLPNELRAAYPRVVFAPDGRSAVGWPTVAGAMGRLEHTLYLFPLEAGKPARKLSGHTDRLFSVAFTPDGRRIVSVDRDYLRLWDTTTGEAVGSWVKSRDNDEGEAMAVSPDGRLAALGGSTGSVFHVGVNLRDLTTGLSPRSLRGHKKSVRGLAFLPDSRLLTGGGDGAIRLWDLATGEPVGPR